MDFSPKNNCYIDNKGKSEKLGFFKIEKTTLTISALCLQKGRNYKFLVLKYKHKAEQDRIAYPLPTKIEKKRGGVQLSSQIELQQFPLRMTNWQIVAAYEEEGRLYGAQLKACNDSRDVFKRFKSDYYCDLGEYILFPYYSKSGIFNLRYRPRNEYDSKEVHKRELAAYKKSRRLFKVKPFNQSIALIYEKRCTSAQDNGYYLFKYCMENKVNESGKLKVYYVLDKRTPAYEKMKKYDKYVLDFMSIEHMECLLAAKLLISSESRAHVYAWHSKNSIIAHCVQDKKHVFLGHGILALKQLNNSFTAKTMSSSIVTVSSEREGNIFREYLGYTDDAIKLSGYARFDALIDKSDQCREILIMPTHRERLFGVEKERFAGSEYYKRYMNLINSKRFISLLEKKDLKAKFYLHPSIREQVDLFKSDNDRVEIIKYGEVALDELMMRCRMLITDYSSITWDVLYMNKPVSFYQFDREEYLGSWGSYVDLEKDLPGDCATDEDELINHIEETIKNNFQISDENKKKLKEFYKYNDRDNCKRIWEEIARLI